ncbi:hypothetical protein DL96DRAFT_846342 [Flagelloscypha sp. PMI_526]|nr:hypothetical protein DL96DRAFT_846342 [Flagelloscypha sp. PMI_526]
MTFEAHRLTLELMDNIIDFVGSNEDLQSWALTCTSLLPRARTNLFRVVTVQEHSQILSLETLVVNSPHIRPYIIHLGAVNFLEYDPSSYPGDKLTPYIQAQFWIKILLSLKGTLRTFSIIPQRLFAGRWSEIPYPLQRALLKVSETPNFEGMDCQFFGTCRTALELLPSIRHLDLYYHEDRFTSPSSTHVYLKSLRLSFMTKVRPWVSQRKPEEDFDFSRRESLINLSQLERLVVEPNIASRVFGEDLAEDEREEDDPGAEGSHRLKCHFMSGIWLTALARPASQSLVTIYWEVGALDKDRESFALFKNSVT